MKITDTSAEFFAMYESTPQLTVEQLKQYYAKYPEMFDAYFESHCQRTEERLNQAIERYPEQMEMMRQVAAQLPALAAEIQERMNAVLGVDYELDLYVLVGGFGSYAYVDHSSRVFFSIEQLSDTPDHLRVMIAHEFAHAFHHKLLAAAHFDWSKMAWDGFTSLYLEGTASYISKRVVPGLPERVYFSFNDSGDEKLEFYKTHREELKRVFLQDLPEWTMVQEREWFRVKGEKRYGFHSLGYMVGCEFLESLAEQMDARSCMTFWAYEDLKERVTAWLQAPSAHSLS